jgi:signal transduction histidine kinase
VNRALQPSSSLSGLLPYLEWILLGLITLNVVLTASVYPYPTFALPSLLSVAAFGVLGFRVPTGKLVYKVLYTALEFGIILLPNLIDARVRPVPLLGLIAITRGFQMFDLRGRLVVTGLAFLSFLWAVFLKGQTFMAECKPLGLIEPRFEQLLNNPLNFQLSSALSFGMTLVFAFPLLYALLAERQSRSQLSAAHEQLRLYALRIEDQATLQERNRIAREIHDSLGHLMTAQSIQLENALLFLQSNPQRAEAFLIESQNLGARALQELRQSVVALRVDPLEGQTLPDAIASLIVEFSATTAITPECTIRLSALLTNEINVVLYRIVQEALTNIVKHSDATQVQIYLYDEDGRAHLLIEDNGKGFNPELNTTGFGLQGMRERANALGGSFTLVSQLGRGCRIIVTVPILGRAV